MCVRRQPVGTRDENFRRHTRWGASEVDVVLDAEGNETDEKLWKKTRTATAGTGRIVTMLISLKPVCSAFSVIRNIPAKMFIIGLPTRCRRLSMKVGVVHAVFSIHWKGCTSVFTIPEVPSGIRQVLAHVEPAQAYGV